MRIYIKLIFGLTLISMMTACEVKVPQEYEKVQNKPSIYPDYTDVTIPCNIAPMNFRIEMEAEEYITQFATPGGVWTIKGQDVCHDINTWRAITESAMNHQIDIEVYVRNGKSWKRFKPFTMCVKSDSIDPYLSYRLIAPSYVAYEDLVICQRNLSDFEESIIFSNMLTSNEKDGQCINCHSYQNYNPDRMQFHGRQAHGGTLINYDGNIQKVNLKTDSTISAGVYPAWHPTAKLIAYSTNLTGQSFHTRDLQKVEVQDTQSDLILYDLEANRVYTVAQDSADMECFPWWSPDGKYLYYCSAHYEKKDTTTLEFELIRNYKDIKYSLYRKSFDVQTLKFGPREMVFDAAAIGKSATLPRISPDGKYLVFTLGGFGVFHIWHKDADLYMLDLQTGNVKPLTDMNSADVESYHSWSSNGRWMVVSSRRNDGNFTRPFFAYIDSTGMPHKAFELPQKSPEYHRNMLRSYNIPEFMKGKVTVSSQTLAKNMKQEARKAIYSGRK